MLISLAFHAFSWASLQVLVEVPIVAGPEYEMDSYESIANCRHQVAYFGNT